MAKITDLSSESFKPTPTGSVASSFYKKYRSDRDAEYSSREIRNLSNSMNALKDEIRTMSRTASNNNRDRIYGRSRPHYMHTGGVAGGSRRVSRDDEYSAVLREGEVVLPTNQKDFFRKFSAAIADSIVKAQTQVDSTKKKVAVMNARQSDVSILSTSGKEYFKSLEEVTEEVQRKVMGLYSGKMLRPSTFKQILGHTAYLFNREYNAELPSTTSGNMQEGIFKTLRSIYVATRASSGENVAVNTQLAKIMMVAFGVQGKLHKAKSVSASAALGRMFRQQLTRPVRAITGRGKFSKKAKPEYYKDVGGAASSAGIPQNLIERLEEILGIPEHETGEEANKTGFKAKSITFNAITQKIHKKIVEGEKRYLERLEKIEKAKAIAKEPYNISSDLYDIAKRTKTGAKLDEKIKEKMPEVKRVASRKYTDIKDFLIEHFSKERKPGSGAMWFDRQDPGLLPRSRRARPKKVVPERLNVDRMDASDLASADVEELSERDILEKTAKSGSLGAAAAEETKKHAEKSVEIDEKREKREKEKEKKDKWDGLKSKQQKDKAAKSPKSISDIIGNIAFTAVGGASLGVLSEAIFGSGSFKTILKAGAGATIGGIIGSMIGIVGGMPGMILGFGVGAYVGGMIGRARPNPIGDIKSSFLFMKDIGAFIWKNRNGAILGGITGALIGVAAGPLGIGLGAFTGALIGAHLDENISRGKQEHNKVVGRWEGSLTKQWYDFIKNNHGGMVVGAVGGLVLGTMIGLPHLGMYAGAMVGGKINQWMGDGKSGFSRLFTGEGQKYMSLDWWVNNKEGAIIGGAAGLVFASKLALKYPQVAGLAAYTGAFVGAHIQSMFTGGKRHFDEYGRDVTLFSTGFYTENIEGTLIGGTIGALVGIKLGIVGKPKWAAMVLFGGATIGAGLQQAGKDAMSATGMTKFMAEKMGVANLGGAGLAARSIGFLLGSIIGGVIGLGAGPPGVALGMSIGGAAGSFIAYTIAQVGHSTNKTINAFDELEQNKKQTSELQRREAMGSIDTAQKLTDAGTFKHDPMEAYKFAGEAYKTEVQAGRMTLAEMERNMELDRNAYVESHSRAKSEYEKRKQILEDRKKDLSERLYAMQMSPGYDPNNPADAETRKSLQEANMELKKLEENKDMMIRIEQQKLFVRFLENEMRDVDIVREGRGVSGGVHNSFSKRFVGNFTLDDKPASTEVISEENVNKESEYMQSAVDNVKEVITSVAGSVPADAGATGGPDDESGGLYTKTLEAAKSSGESINKFIQGFTQSVSEGDTTSNTSGTLPAWPPPGVEVATIRDVDENGNPIQTSWLDVAKKFASGAASSYSETSKKFMETYGKDSETGDSIDPISGVIRKASGMLPQDVGESDLKLMRLLESEVEGGTLTEERLEELRKDYPNEFDTLSARTQSAISLGYSAVTGNKRRPEDPESFLQSLGTASNVDFSSVTGYTNPYGFESISGLAMGVNAQEDVNLGAPNPFMEKLGEVSIRLQDLAMKGKDAIMRSATAVAEYLRSCGIDVGDFSSISELFGGSFGDIAGRLGGSASSTYNNFFGGGNAGGRSTTEKTPVNQTGLKTDRYFLKDLVNVSNRMNMDPIALLAVMESESNVNPKSFNSAGPAGGLIQFTPTGLESINSKLSPTDITNLGWREQLKLSEQFLRKNAGGKPFNRIEDAKLAVFAPAHMGKPPAATVYGKNDKVPRYYRANKTLDYNNDGKITVAEVGDRVTRIYNTMAEWDIWKELGVTPRHLGEGKSSGAYEFGNMSDVGPVSFPTEGSGNWPAPNYINTVTSLYGMRKGKMHEGVDIAGDPSNTSGQPAFTMWPGVVSFVGEFGGGGGNTVMVKHPDSGLTTVYMHLKDIAVETGETVDAKDKIGTIGATGGNYRPHLHFEIWKGDRDKAKKRGASIDPLEAFQSMGSVYSVTQKAYKESQGKPPTQDYGTKTWDYKAEESSTDYKEHKPHKTDSWEERLKGVEVAMVGPAVDTNATGGPRSMGRPKSRTQRAGNSGSSSSNGKKKKTPFGWSPVVKEMFTGKKSTTPATNNEDRMTHQEYSILSEATNSMRTRLEDMGYEWERNRGMVPKKEKPKTEEEWDGKTFRIGKDIEVTLIDPYVYYGQDEGLDPPETSVQFLLKDKKRIAKLYVDIDRGKVIPPSKQKGPNGSGNAVFDEFTKSSAELNKMRNELEIYGYTWDENKGMIHISELPRKPGETWNGSTFTKDTTIREYLGNPYVYPGYSEGYLPTQKALSLIERDKKQIPKLLEDVKSGRIEKPMLEEYMVPMTPTEIPLYKSPKTPNVQSGAMGNRTQPAGATNKTHSESNMTTSTTTGKDLTVGSGSGQGSSPASDWKVLSSYSGPARTQESPRETTTNNPISDMMVKMQAAMSSLTTQMSQTNTSRVTEAIGSAAQQTSESVANVVISTTNAIRSSSNNTTTSQGSQGGSGSGPANKVLDIENELVNILLRGRTRI